MSILRENLKYYRKQKGLTQKELEKIAGVAQTAITKYENGILSKLHYNLSQML